MDGTGLVDFRQIVPCIPPLEGSERAATNVDKLEPTTARTNHIDAIHLLSSPPHEIYEQAVVLYIHCIYMCSTLQ